MNIQILETAPRNWKELQHFVSDLLNNCGYIATTEKTIETVRGIVEVDVYAERKTSFLLSILCECKYWNAKIPQTTIHALRTVVEDSGANKGIIISKHGFQKGTYMAISNSTISLYNWSEFEEAFKIEYLNFVIDRNYKKGYEVQVKAISVIQNSSALTADELDKFQLLRENYSNLLFYSFRNHYENFDTKEITLGDTYRGIQMGAKDLGIKPTSLKTYFEHIYFGCVDNLSIVDSTLALTKERMKK